METRTRRTPTEGRSSGFDDAPALSMVKVPSDPAQVIVNHASFRVQLGASARRTYSPRVARQVSGAQDAARGPGAGTAAGRRRPVVWSGRSAPDDSGAHRLLQAVRTSSVRHGEESADAGATQVIPRIGADGLPGPDGYDDHLTARTLQTPVVGSQRGSLDGETRMLPPMHRVGSAYDEPGGGGPDYGHDRHGYDEQPYDEQPYDESEFAGAEGAWAEGPEPRTRRHGSRLTPAAAGASVRHAYYPGRRMNLGVVLLPLRVFLGFVSAYAGMRKLCDPLYFAGGERGLMVTWLNTLHPWQIAEPLRQFALQHPVGTGLSIAFLQVLVGVLTVLGLWQRAAATVGALLSAALIVTLSWRTTPGYDAPHIIYLAAWSPLVIAGAPVYSVDGRLAGSAWRRLGPRAGLWELRQYVLRRRAVVMGLVTGVTLLAGSLLGGAVRDAGRVVVPGPAEAPRNELPGSPLPETPGKRQHPSNPSASQSPRPSSSPSGAPRTPSTPSTAGATGSVTGGGQLSRTQGTVGQAPRHSAPAQQSPSAGPSSSGGTGTAGPTHGGTSGAEGGSSSGGSDHLVGGLLG